MKCIYRTRYECKIPMRMMNENTEDTCRLCLAGQQVDATELLTSAVMELSFKKAEEKAIREGYEADAIQEALQD